MASAAAGDPFSPWNDPSMEVHFDRTLASIEKAQDKDLAQSMGLTYLAAGIGHMLFTSPPPCRYDWSAVEEAVGAPALASLINVICEPSRTGLPLTVDQLLRARLRAPHLVRSRFAAAQERAGNIMDGMDSATRQDFTGHINSADAWKDIRTGKNVLSSALHAIAAGIEEEAIEACTIALTEFDAAGVEEFVDEIFGRYSSTRLALANRTRMLGSTEGIRDFIAQVLADLAPEGISHDESRAVAFTGKLIEAIIHAEAEIDSLHGSEMVEAACSILSNTLGAMRSVLVDLGTPNAPENVDDLLLAEQATLPIELGSILNVTSPSRSVYAVGKEVIFEGEPAALMERIIKSPRLVPDSHGMKAAAHLHLNERRIGAASVALIHASYEDTCDGLYEQFDNLCAERRLLSLGQIHDALSAVEAATATGRITEDEAVEMQLLLDALEARVEHLPVRSPIEIRPSTGNPMNFHDLDRAIQIKVLDVLEAGAGATA